MLLAARTRQGPQNRRGITALCTSKDLVTWTIAEPFWSPDLYFTHECPDLFQMGEDWYSIYSTFSERMLTHYRRARDLRAVRHRGETSCLRHEDEGLHRRQSVHCCVFCNIHYRICVFFCRMASPRLVL